MSTEGKAQEIISGLVKRFGEHSESYKRGDYNETQLRREFLDPFFEALGWDVYNSLGYAEAYKDVIHEDSISVGGTVKAPDYCFRIGGVRKFFVEAKKPSVNLKDDISPAFQLRRYAWSAKLPLSILTDFEEFAVYDCRYKPVKTDKASRGRVLYFTYDQYIERWEEISSIFARESILKGSFDKYAETGRQKRGTAEVDDAFLKEIESWRDVLARNIALRNPRLTQRELNFSVQRTIDRIVFLRICEDRNIERYGRLMALLNGTNVYRRMVELFRQADDKYNSGLFHFQKEKDRPEPPDELTTSLRIDDKHLKDIIKRLYYPDSPYEFSVLPADILGQVYEQFLGKVIRLTRGHRAVIEEKPEVRKAGGVYYTPTYIVDYIVKNTVGKLLEGKTPKKLNTLRVLDPACGSGSFLLGAYQYLLDWHREWYVGNDPEKWAIGKKPAIYQTGQVIGGDWRLTTSEKKRILLNNIYGVDIDSQAVEVTKLSLLLKVLEDENNDSLNTQMKLYHERALPDLRNNIRCGNSLIGPDFYEGRDMSLFGEEERYRINVFDWEREFGGIMKAGGFDAVIGNPPYVQQSMDNVTIQYKDYLITSYESSMGRLNTFGFFIKKAINLLDEGCLMGLIVPNTLLTQEYYEQLRNAILSSCKIKSIVNFSELPFKDAVVENIIIILQKSQQTTRSTNYANIYDVNEKYEFIEIRNIEQDIFSKTHKKAFNINLDSRLFAFVEKLKKNSLLKKFLQVNQAIALKHERKKYLSDKMFDDSYKPLLDGRNIHRYLLQWDGTYLKYDINAIHSCKREDIFITAEKIFFRRVGDRLIATLDGDKFYALNTLVVMNLKDNTTYNIRYFLALFNSSLLDFFYKKFLKSTKKVFSEIQARQVEQLPIRTIDFDDPEDKARHDKMVSLVDQMLEMNKKLQKARTGHEQNTLKRQLEYTDRQIDNLVYELYGLTDEEIRIVEGDKQ